MARLNARSNSLNPSGMPRRGLMRLAVTTALMMGIILGVALAANAGITKIQIISRGPAFGGYSFPKVGTYERIVGKGFGEISPTDGHNKVIVDIGLGPRNARGRVEYSFDFYILKPTDLSKGNHKVFYEAPNRGSKLFGNFNRSTSGNDPAATRDPASLFLAPQGYAMVWSGWDFGAGTDNSNLNLTITLPIAKNPDGSAITGPAYEYIVSPGGSYTLNYPPATLDQTKATLTHRVHLDDEPQIVPASGWEYTNGGNGIRLLPAGASFTANDIYEFSYIAKDPTVNGIGFAAVRDFNSFLRYATEDSAGTMNPLAGDVTRIYTYTQSQPGRMLNDFRDLGFNEDENGKIVFDGMLQWIAAGDGINMNYRFSQPARTERNRQDQLYVEGVFPFANQRTSDPISGKTAGRYDKCSKTKTCPLAMEVYSANEYWVKAASLFTTDPAGKKDLPDHPMARDYLISSEQHGTGNAASKGNCQQLQNPLDSAPVLRALFMALDEWSTKGVAPPASAIPRLADGTLVPPLPQSGVGFPKIPGITYTGLMSTRYLFDYGADFYRTGIMTTNPPAVKPPIFNNPKNGAIYPSYVPKTDADGNDIAGVRLPDVSVPLATYTGWALRSGPQANDGCEAAGQYMPFAKTKTDRMASGDPRLSIEERYPSLSAYSSAVEKAIDDMIAKRLMLQEDRAANVNRLMRAAMATGAMKVDTASQDLAGPR
jgi:alpha/beta hydrolase family protein